jgi:phage gpG-like protein
MVRIKVSVDAEKAIDRMSDMEKRSRDFRVVLRFAKAELAKANKLNFNSLGLPVGGWSPLQPRYASWKAREFPGTPPMIVSGKLFRSLTQLDGPANSIGLTKATFGTDIEYAKFHQYGTTKMAKRKIVYEPVLFAKSLAIIAAGYVADGRVRMFR